jgi:tRNA-splicing ligase RtcB
LKKKRNKIIIYSGSRRIGKETCDYYHNVAGRQMSKRHLPVINELKYLEIDSSEGQDYLIDMRWCLNYAEQNRRIMLDELCLIMKSVTGYQVDLKRMVNIHHNYCQQENISFENSPEEFVWVTRKGATSARKGQLGIIPGSMGTGSFIVEGLGNPLSFYSCSHGAGRLMSRTMVCLFFVVGIIRNLSLGIFLKAMKQISQQSFEQAMKGIVSDTNTALRDEAPQAYKVNANDIYYVVNIIVQF